MILHPPWVVPTLKAGHTRWDERLVLGSGWLYKQDLKIEQLWKQQDAVAQYFDTVDEVLFGGTRGGVRWDASDMMFTSRTRKVRALLLPPFSLLNPNASPQNKNNYNIFSAFSRKGQVIETFRGAGIYQPTRRLRDRKATRGCVLAVFPGRSFVPAHRPPR